MLINKVIYNEKSLKNKAKKQPHFQVVFQVFLCVFFWLGFFIPTLGCIIVVVSVQGRLKPSLFPCLGSNYEGKIVNVVVFVIGGFTYEEAYSIYQLNSTLKVTQFQVWNASHGRTFACYLIKVFLCLTNSFRIVSYWPGLFWKQ